MTLKKDGTPRKKNKLRIDRGLPRQKTSIMALMKSMKPGESFYCDKDDKHITAHAHHLNVKVLTTRCLVVENTHAVSPEIKRITKVTII